MHYRAFLTKDDNSSYGLTYYHNPLRWENCMKFLSGNPILDMSNWTPEYKFYNENGEKSVQINQLPDDKGGIYLFYLKGICLPFFENYILYIGKASITDNENIRSRVKSYYNVPKNRYLIIEMFSKWKDYIYCRCYPETNNEKIGLDESLLINTILPYYNEDIPDKIHVQPEINAF